MSKAFAICNKTDEHFQGNGIYNIVTMHDNMFVLFDENNEQCEVGLDDENFTFVFNPTYQAALLIQSYCGYN